MFRKMPFILALVVLCIVVLDPFIPLPLKQALYALSLNIKSLIIVMLPFIIFGLLFKASVTLSSNATKIIGLILVLVCCSNFLSTFLSHFIGMWTYNFNLSMIVPQQGLDLTPLWSFELPCLIPNNIAMFSGIVFGILGSYFFNRVTTLWAKSFDLWIGYVLKSFTYMIPIFVSGFVVKLQYDGVVGTIIKDYTAIFALIAIAQFSYINLLYFIFSNGKVSEYVSSIKNMLPAGICGFSTMSSAASMPLTIIGAENNAKNKDVARSVIPATVNIHLIGDCFAIPVFAYAILKSFGMPELSLMNYMIFSFYFVLAKFSVAAIPGGGIIVMLPVLESYLGFNSSMMSLITALYILFDPVVTCANVLGNGAFAKMIDRVVKSPSVDKVPSHSINLRKGA